MSDNNSNSIGAYGLLEFDGHDSIGVKLDLIGGNHQMRHFLSPDKGHKYLKQYNPTPTFLKPLLEKMKEPSVLLLQGCDMLLQLQGQYSFPFEKFKTLTTLEISGISHLTTVPVTISDMTQLQGLCLSHLPITLLPDDLFSKLTNLRSLVLRDCSELHSLPTFPELPTLECLDLSHLPIETLDLPVPTMFQPCLQELRWLILKGCSKLCFLPPIDVFSKLEVVDLSHCTTLQKIGRFVRFDHPSLKMLDLSYTALRNINIAYNDNLTHLFLRDTKATVEFDSDKSVTALKIADLSGIANLQGIDILGNKHDLASLDLSRTGIESIDFISNLVQLRHLILRECTRLLNLPEVARLTNLELLDMSGCTILTNLPKDLHKLGNLKDLNLSRCSALKELREGLFDHMSFLEKLDLSKTNVHHLPSLANLTNLQTLNLSQTLVQKVPDLTHLMNLKEIILVSFENTKQSPANLDSVNRRQNDELHLVSTTFISESGFDRFKFGFTKLDLLFSNIEKNIKPTSVECTNKTSETFRRNFGSMRADLRYILESIDLLESSPDCTSSEELLNVLVNVGNRLSVTEFLLHSTKLSTLLRVVAEGIMYFNKMFNYLLLKYYY